MLLKLTCSQIHYICTNHTATYLHQAILSNSRIAASSMLPSRNPADPTTNRISKIRTLLPTSSGSHCWGQHTSGCPFCTHVSPGLQRNGGVLAYSTSLKNTTSMFVTLLSPSGGHSWLTHDSFCNQKHKALPNASSTQLIFLTLEQLCQSPKTVGNNKSPSWPSRRTEHISLRAVESSTPNIAWTNKNSTGTSSTIPKSQKRTLCKMEPELTVRVLLMIAQSAGTPSP